MKMKVLLDSTNDALRHGEFVKPSAAETILDSEDEKVTTLRELARANDVEVPAKATKKDLLELLESAFAELPDQNGPHCPTGY
jgi:hypothetical protein